MVLFLLAHVVAAGLFPDGFQNDGEAFERIPGTRLGNLLTQPIPGDAPWRTVQVVDARWDLEYAGGHVRGALNCHYQLPEVAKFYAAHYDPTTLFVAHCEWSLFRGSHVAYHLMQCHANGPHAAQPLFVVVLHDGFSQFYPRYPHFCEDEYSPDVKLDHRNPENSAFLKWAHAKVGEDKRQEFI
jgi:hypothetical protein